MVIESCDISDDDIISWWDAFLSKPNLKTGIPNSITGSNNRVFIFGNDENVSPVGTFRGKLRLKENTKQRVIGPVINTNSEDKNSAEFETSNASHLYAFVRGVGYTGGVEQVQWETKYTHLGNKFPYPFSGGAWFCIPAKALNSGDRVEFGGEGQRGFTTAAVYVVEIGR